jgi:hypothetical protein
VQLNPGALAIIPLLLGVFLLVSGGTKVGRVDRTQATIRALGIPLIADSRAAAATAPWIELVLGAGLLLLPGAGFAIAAWGATALMLFFTIVVGSVLWRGDEVPCGCLGSLDAEPIGIATLVRNLLLLVSAVAVALGGSVAGGLIPAIAGFRGDDLTWLVALAAVAVLSSWLWARGRPRPSTASEPSTGAATRIPTPPYPIPDVELVDADGVSRSLASLSASRACLLLFVKPNCVFCAAVVSRVPEWRRLLGETIDIVAATSASPAALAAAYPVLSEHALFGSKAARDAFGVFGSPAAILLGTDGTVAAGPVHGEAPIAALIGGIAQAIELSG